MQNHNPQSGNVLFYILIAVVLLAALSYAVSQSGRGSAQTINEERARLIASEILEYSNSIASAVSQLRLRGCSDTQISFENNVESGYTNPNAPSDEFCHIFSLNGGAINWIDPQEQVNDGTGDIATWFFDKRLVAPGHGSCDTGTDSSCKDLKMLLRVDEKICDAINESILGQKVTWTGARGVLHVSKFDGSYSTSTGAICGGQYLPWCEVNSTYCIFNNAVGNGAGTEPNYTFVKVLIPR